MISWSSLRQDRGAGGWVNFLEIEAYNLTEIQKDEEKKRQWGAALTIYCIKTLSVGFLKKYSLNY